MKKGGQAALKLDFGPDDVFVLSGRRSVGLSGIIGTRAATLEVAEPAAVFEWLQAERDVLLEAEVPTCGFEYLILNFASVT